MMEAFLREQSLGPVWQVPMTMDEPPLQGWLEEAGWRPESLVGRINEYARAHGVKYVLSRKAAYHWLNGGRPRPPAPGLVAAVLSEALGRSVTVSALGWADDVSGPVPADEGLEELWMPGRALGVLEMVLSEQSRRTFLAVSGLALTATAHQWMLDTERLAFAASGRRVDMSVVADLEQVVDAKRRIDDALGGGVLLASVREELRLVVSLLRGGNYGEEVGKRLYAAAAELARLAGWARFDSDDVAGAQRYFLVALRAAHLSQDQALGAHVLGFMAVQATLSGRPGDAITLLKSAYAGAKGAMTKTEQAALFGRLARAHGKAGDVYATDTCAERALSLLAEADPAVDPPWIYWCDQADLSGMIGEGYVALGDSERADGYLSTAVDELGSSRPRDRAIWVISRATAHLAAGQSDQALQHARDAADVATGLNSDRIVGYLGAFRRELHRAPRTTATGEFDEHLRAVFPRRLHPALALA